MARWAPERRDTLAAIVAMLRGLYPRGRVMIAIDGLTASGKSTFADDLATSWRDAVSGAPGASATTVLRASVDDFLRPRAARYARGRDSAEGRYLDSYDYSLLRRVLIEPFRMGGSTGFQLRGFDRDADRAFQSEWTTAGPDAVLIVDGSFLNRPELRGVWNAVIWLEADAAVRDARILERDGITPDSPTAGRYRGAGELYEATNPREAATLIVDNTAPAHPRQRFADSC